MPARHFAALVAAFLISSETLAGSFTVAPIRLELKQPRRAVSMEVQNTGDRPAQIQVERYRWLADREGEDLLEPTEEVIATPPIFTLAPGQKQIVRVIAFGAPDPAKEAAYRVILQETALDDPPPNVVRALLRISIPMFITPARARPSLAVSSSRESDVWWLFLENTGNAHAQVTGARTAGGEPIKANGYLLPGERRRVRIAAPLDELFVTLRDQPEQVFSVRAVP
jgi:fimbrial chaperone protein